MTKQEEPIDDDEQGPSDLSKLELVGRAIYAERFRRGTNLTQSIERDREADEEQSADGDLLPEYDFSKMRIVKRGPGRRREPAIQKPKRK